MKMLIFFLLYLSTQINAGSLYVLTGGPGVGKSSVIAQLNKKGYQTVDEMYTTLYEKAAQEQRIDTLFTNTIDFYWLLTHEQLAAESTLNKTMPAFLDRCPIDTLAFADYYNILLPDALKAKVHTAYDLVFFLDPLPAHYYQQNELRKESPEQSGAIHSLLKNVYLKKGLCIIDVPFGTPQDRADFILDTIKAKCLKTNPLI